MIKRPQGIVACVIAFYWLAFVLNNASNIPIMDDYDAILQYLIDFHEEDAIGSVRAVLSPHNEHPLVFSNLVVAVSHLAFGQINFVYLILLANSLLVLMVLLLCREAELNDIPVPILILSLLFFNLSTGTIMIWSMAALQHFSSVVLAFLALSLFCSEEKRSSCLLRYLVLYFATLSGGANISLLPVISIYLISRRELKALLILGSHSVIIGGVLLYFSNHTGSMTSLNFMDSAKFFLLFLGNPVHSEGAYVLGSAMLLAVALAWRHGCHRRYPVLFYYVIFTFCVGAAAAISRVSYGAEYALAHKYTIYSISGLACILLMFYASIKKKPANTPGVQLAALLAFSLSAFIYTDSWSSNRTEIMELARAHWIIYPSHRHAVEILTKAQQHDLYDAQRYIVNYPGSLQ